MSSALPIKKWTQKNPKILINYNLSIEPIFVFHCQNSPEGKRRGWDKWVVPTREEVVKKVFAYRKEWSKYEKKILNGICDILELNFKTNIIAAHIVSGNISSKGYPIIIKSGFLPDEFVDELTHELIHQLFNLNELGRIKFEVKKKYAGESRIARQHIIVHAVSKYIYLDILKQPYRLDRNLSRSKKHSTNDYSRAWEIVEQEGYHKIISDFKNKCKKIKKR